MTKSNSIPLKVPGAYRSLYSDIYKSFRIRSNSIIMNRKKIITILHILITPVLVMLSIKGCMSIKEDAEATLYMWTHQTEDLYKGEVIEDLNEELGLNYKFFNYEWLCGKHHSYFQQWMTYSVLRFEDDSFLEQVKKSEEWSRQKNDKCEEIVNIAIEKAFEDSGIDLKPSKNLYWYHIDTAPDDITEESGYNAIYDADQRILYYTHHWMCL